MLQASCPRTTVLLQSSGAHDHGPSDSVIAGSFILTCVFCRDDGDVHYNV